MLFKEHELAFKPTLMYLIKHDIENTYYKSLIKNTQDAFGNC